MAAKFEEALLSIRLEWDLSTPAKEIVEKVRQQDLSSIFSLEEKCKNQLLPIAFRLAQGLEIPAVVALLLHGGRTILNSVLKKESFEINDPFKISEGGACLAGKMADTTVNIIHKQGESVTNPLARKVETPVINFPGRKIDEMDDTSEGTIVDLLLGMALAHSNSCNLNKFGARYKSVAYEGLGSLWQGGDSSVYSLGSGDVDTNLGSDTLMRPKDRESGTSDNSNLKDFSNWDESFQIFSSTLDSGEWEEVVTRSRKKSTTAPEAVAKDVINDNLKKTLSGESKVELTTISTPPDNFSLPAGVDVEYKCEIARKLLECVLLFSPPLSGHPQSHHLPPLLRAAQANDEALVGLLLDAWAPINDKDSYGNTALHWALRQATPANRRTVNSQVVRRLLKAGANVKAGNKLGATPVHTAAGHGHFEALSFILEKDLSVVNVLAITKETPLHYAVKNNHIECTFLLLKHGANRNVASKRDQKPIQLALSVEMRVLLLQDDKVLKDNTWESFKPILMSAVSSSSSLHSLAIQSQTQFPSFVDAFGFQQSTQDGNTFDWLSSQALSINNRDLILGSDIHTLEGKESVNLPQHKAVACYFFASSDGCARGSKCHFAHSEEEIIGVARVDGLDMRAVGSQNVDGSDQSTRNFKTKLCTHHEKTGKCPHGVKCTFAHGVVELRGSPSPATTYVRALPGIDARPSSVNSMGSSTGSEKGDDYSARKVFVGGLPHFVQSDDLWECFEAEFGKVVDAVVIACIDADKNVRSRGFGFVVFNDPRDANAAVKRHYLPFRGKKVEVKQAMAQEDFGEEPIKPTFPISPVSISNSPTFGPSSPVIARSKELASASSEVSQRAWSASPSAVDWLSKSSEEGTKSRSLPISELNNHLDYKHSVPVHNYQSPFQNCGPIFPLSSSVLLDAGLDRLSYLDSGPGSISPSPSHSFSSPSSASPGRHLSSMYGSSIPYSNGTSFVKDDIDRPAQSYFTVIAGPSVHSSGSDPPAHTDDEKEFNDLLAMLQGGKS